MAKVKWGGGITADAIDEVDTSKQFVPYDGPEPGRGVYGFGIELRKSKSQPGNDQLEVFLRLDPRDRPEHKKYAGFPMRDWIPVMQQTAFRVRALTDALGVTSKDFVTRTVVDEKGNVIKIGDVVIAKALIRANIQIGEKYHEVRSYLPAQDADDTDTDADDDDADDGEAAPF